MGQARAKKGPVGPGRHAGPGGQAGPGRQGLTASDDSPLHWWLWKLKSLGKSVNLANEGNS